jgi:hypothetical protein
MLEMLHYCARACGSFRVAGARVVSEKFDIVSEAGRHGYILGRMAVQRIIDKIQALRRSRERLINAR